MTEIDYTNARPLDVHRWSEYPEVNDFVGHVFTDLKAVNGNAQISKKLVKVILLDLYVAWCADSRLMLMFSRETITPTNPNLDITSCTLARRSLVLLTH